MTQENKSQIEFYQNELAELAKFPEMNPGPVCRFDRAGKVLLANTKAKDLFGEDNLLGKNWKDVCPDMNDEVWGKIVECRDTYLHETDVAGGCWVFTHVCTENYAFVYGTDITKNVLNERKLEDQKKMIEEVARFPDMNPGPVLRVNFDSEILLSNKAATEVFGENLVSKKWTEVIHKIDTKKWIEIVNATDIVPIEIKIGEKFFVFQHRADAKSSFVFIFGTDVTQQKSTEQSLRQSEKMATLGTLAAGVTHELNNPAAATTRAAQQLVEVFTKSEKVFQEASAMSFSESELSIMQSLSTKINLDAQQSNNLDAITRSDLESDMEDLLDENDIDNGWELAPLLVSALLNVDDIKYIFSESTKEKSEIIINWACNTISAYSLLHEIGEGSGRISEIVVALKNYSFLGQAPVLNVDIHNGIDNTLVILRSKMKKGITVNRKFNDKLPHIMAFGSELNQVWTNILDNAIDAMGGEGTITISTCTEGNDKIKVEIEDNGPGIPKEIQSRIFDPFFTSKEPGKGTGLGLSTSYGIINDKHKGKISVTSEPKKTIFTIILPINQ